MNSDQLMLDFYKHNKETPPNYPIKDFAAEVTKLIPKSKLFTIDTHVNEQGGIYYKVLVKNGFFSDRFDGYNPVLILEHIKLLYNLG